MHMADVTISALTQAFPAGSGIIPFSSGTSTFGSAISALYLDSNPYKTNATLPWTKLVVAHDTTNDTVGAGPSGSLALASFYANTIVGNDAVPRGLEIGAPAGNVTAPVYLKVSSTSNRFAIFDQFNNENFTIYNRNVGIGTAAPTSRLDVRGVQGTVYTSPATVPSGTTVTVLDPSGNRLANPPVYGHFNEWVRSTFGIQGDQSFIVQATCIWGVQYAMDAAVFLILYGHGIQTCDIKRMDNGYARLAGNTFVSGGGPGPSQAPVIKCTHTGTGTATVKFHVQLLGVFN